jgi:phenylacetate-CoA ligase
MDRLANMALPHSERSFLVFSKIYPSLFEYYSRKKMLYMFKRSAKQIPAYRRFLQEHNISQSDIKNIKDFDCLVPSTTKENYINIYPLADRCIDGKFPSDGTFEESSGTSGKATLWIRSKKEEEYTEVLVSASLIHLYGFKKEDRIIALNCFMLGGWSGGIKFASRVSTLAGVRNIGPDPLKTINCIREFGKGYSFLIGGYPPFIVELIETGKSLDDFNWKDYHIHIFAGGEGFVEEWRDYISSQLRDDPLIFSDYGAIDLDVGISVETPFSVALRRLINNNKELRNKILATERLPCFMGQCSPQEFYVREKRDLSGKKEIEITVMNLKSSSPTIKYTIGDEGGIIRYGQLCKILDTSGYPIEKIKREFKISSIVPFPVLYLFGRKDGTVSIDGALISPDEINRVILSDPELLKVINTFKISAESGSDKYIRLFINLEARKDIAIEEEFINRFRKAVINSLIDSNTCFRYGYIKNPESHEPVINIFHFGTGVFAVNNDKLKNIYSG